MDKFFADAVGKQKSNKVTDNSEALEKFPNGVVLGKDGKPCRTCTSSAEWKALMNMKTRPASPSTTSQVSTTTLPSASITSSYESRLLPDCPPDVDVLGRSTWTLLHSISAQYPPVANPTQQSEMKQFLSLFGKLYPCWVCAEDFRDWMAKRGNEPKVAGRDEFGKWMCEAHNEVNRKLGKEEFNCALWEERWRTGWKDGRCD
ncbi:MAG: hypothetical protein MMC33_007290 [Icmadophila ericetorum]|nr:hypothetical protein [Icmadophila ericetorum]